MALCYLIHQKVKTSVLSTSLLEQNKNTQAHTYTHTYTHRGSPHFVVQKHRDNYINQTTKQSS